MSHIWYSIDPIAEVLTHDYVNNEYVDQTRRQTKRSVVRNQADDRPYLRIFIKKGRTGIDRPGMGKVNLFRYAGESF